MKSIFEENFLVDSNILVYYLDADSRYNILIDHFFSQCEKNKFPVFISLQNIVELTSVLIKKHKVPKGIALEKIKKLVHSGLFQIISSSPSTEYNFFEIMNVLPKPDIFDVFLAATMMDNNIYTIITNNQRDFKSIKNLRAVGLKEVEKMVETGENTRN